MTASLTIAGSRHRALWSAAVFDTGMAVAVMRPGASGQWFADVIADLLVGAGCIQPTPVPAPRAVTRSDMGRLQVALARSQRDVAIMHAERLSATDARLLRLATARAGVALHLVAEQDPANGLVDWAEQSAPQQDPQALVASWAGRATASARTEAWPCAAALLLGRDGGPACQRHVTAAECALAWFPHAFATARAVPSVIRARLHELGRLDPGSRWAIWEHARDTHHGAMQAAHAAALTAGAVRAATIDDLTDAGTQLNVAGHAFALPAGPDRVIALQRDIKAAEGQPGNAKLFAVRDASARLYLARRAGDPPPAT